MPTSAMTAVRSIQAQFYGLENRTDSQKKKKNIHDKYTNGLTIPI